MVKIKSATGILAFIIVLLTMPLGHAAMILMEKVFGHEHVYLAALILGVIGVVLLLIGYKIKNDTTATLLGLFGGLFIWTGWIEFAYVYYANRYGVQPLMENGEIITKPEYLLLPSSIGFIVMLVLFLLFNGFSKCNFISWWRRIFKIGSIKLPEANERPVTIITAFELITILWTFYIVLLISYDNAFFGDRHPVSYIVAFGSLIWSIYLFLKLIKINKFGLAIRYAIPTVVIFWNFVEILGRWNIFKEIWIYPMEYWLEMSLIAIAFITLVLIALVEKKQVTPS